MIRDKIAAVIVENRACQNWSNPLPADLELADAILAALPGMVPDLVWEVSHHSNGQRAGGYYICINPGHATKPLKLTFLGEFVDYSANLEAAKAAANAHHRAAIAKAAGWTP